MSYRRESPCMKYFEKTRGDGHIRKSLSATRFPPIRRTSDPSSDDSDDFHQLDFSGDLSSSISRSSSESCHSLGSNRCLRKLDEIRSSRSSLNKMQIFDDNFHNNNNESLEEFRSRLRIRRSHKNRDKDQFNYDNEGDKSDISIDSATKEAHEEILRNAESLRREQPEIYNTSSKKLIRSYKPSIRLPNNKNTEKRIDFTEEQTNKLQDIDRSIDLDNSYESRKDTLNRLCSRRQEEIRLATLPKRTSLDYDNSNNDGEMHGLQRSSTDYFGPTNDVGQQKSLTKTAKKIFSSPRLKHKTQSQILRAASSIPSLIFPLKSSNNVNKSVNTIDMLDSSNCNTPESSFGGSKKSSIDEGLICNTPKTRRSPLRFLGNFVDDKLFRGRWGSTKRAKSSVELGRLSWEIPDDLTDNNNNCGNKLNRRKSYIKDDNNLNQHTLKDMPSVTQRIAVNEMPDTSCCKTSSSSTSLSSKHKPRSLSTCADNRNRHRLPSAASDRLSLSSSSAIGSDDADIFLPQQQSPLRTEISADALAEIEAFERLAQSLLK
ncbi:uncharacterized protein LOC128962697 [Oppia nitens]|uniref:uncharacterized protein LOC128962697 n=1 Tax=Oppia nitens TaxID=1686743 RepID=UPI0023DBD19E|nr:uncharacterized protein LOC128962697 [Oppia nitens]